MTNFNERLAMKITSAVGTMWCAYAFAVLALLSLQSAILGGLPTLISWIAQTFLQLVLLSVILVAQNLQARHTSEVKDQIADLHAKNDGLHEHLSALHAHILDLHRHHGVETTPPAAPTN